MTLSNKGKKRGNSVFTVFDILCKNPGSTRADLASEAGLSVTAVGVAVDCLIDDGLVYAFPGVSRGGRPAEVLFPSRNSVSLIDVRERSVRVLLLDLLGNISFFEERETGSPVERNDAARELIGRVAETLPPGEDGLFAVSFISPASCPIDPDVMLYAKKLLSPLFVKTFDPDLLSAAATLSKVKFDDALFCSVRRDGVSVSFCRKNHSGIRLGSFSTPVSSYGTGFGRTFASCRDEKEAAEALSDALFNTLAIISPDLLLFEISGGCFDEKFGDRVRRAITGKLPRVPDVKTIFRDEKRLLSEMLYLLRRTPFEKEGTEE